MDQWPMNEVEDGKGKPLQEVSKTSFIKLQISPVPLKLWCHCPITSALDVRCSKESHFPHRLAFPLLKYVVCLRGKLALRDNLLESWGQIAVSWKQYPSAPALCPAQPSQSQTDVIDRETYTLNKFGVVYHHLPGGMARDKNRYWIYHIEVAHFVPG